MCRRRSSQVADIPRTKSGKITELAVRDIVHGRAGEEPRSAGQSRGAGSLQGHRRPPKLNRRWCKSRRAISGTGARHVCPSCPIKKETECPAIRATTCCSSPCASGRSPPATASTRCPIAPAWAIDMPRSVAPCARSKAEGGWGVVCTEYCSIHPSSDDTPYVFASLVGRVGCEGERRHDRGRSHGMARWRASSSGMAAITTVNRWQPRCRSSRPRACRCITSIRGRPAPWTSRISRRSCAGRPRGGRARDAGRLRHRLCLCRPWLSAVPVHRRRAGTTAPTNMAAASRIAPRLLREMIEDTKEAVGHKARSPCASPSMS